MCSKMYINFHENYPLFSSDFNDSWVLVTDFFKNNQNTKFHENPSSGSRVVPYEQDRHGDDKSRLSKFREKSFGKFYVNDHKLPL